MKKILFVLIVAAFGIVSCKKEDSVKPVKAETATMGGGTLKDMSGMD